MKEAVITQTEWEEVKSWILEIKENLSRLTAEKDAETMSPKEACELLGVNRNTLQNYLSSGLLPSVKIEGKKKIYIKRKDIKELMSKGKI